MKKTGHSPPHIGGSKRGGAKEMSVLPKGDFRAQRDLQFIVVKGPTKKEKVNMSEETTRTKEREEGGRELEPGIDDRWFLTEKEGESWAENRKKGKPWRKETCQTFVGLKEADEGGERLSRRTMRGRKQPTKR